MNNREAMEILALFRPGTADEQDGAFDEARQLSKSDPELAGWFNQHCESTRTLRQKFQSIPIPPGLKEQILSERKIHRPIFQRYWGAALAAAAIVALLLGIEWGIWPIRISPTGYTAYQKRMTEMALRNYYMDWLDKDPEKIRNHLKETNAPADYVLPPGLSKTAVVGGAAAKWQGNNVALICFKTGRPMAPGEQSDLWLFVIDRKVLPEAPPESAPSSAQFKRVNKATTANWSDADHTYLLAAVGDEAFLQKYLQ